MKDYQKKAQNKYNAGFDMVTLRLPKGTKDGIRQFMGNDVNISQFCINSILSELDRLENNPKSQPIDTSKYQDVPTLAPKPSTMIVEDEAKALRVLQHRIDARKANAPRINEDVPESISEGRVMEMDTKDDKAAQMDDMDDKKDIPKRESDPESVGSILEDFMNPPETESVDWLSGRENGIKDRLKQKAEDDEKFKPLTDKRIEAAIKKYGMDLVDDAELADQIIGMHGKTNYERIVATMKHKRMIRTEEDFKIKGNSSI